LTGVDLQDAVNWLNQQADALNAKKTNTSPQKITSIATMQVNLRGQATALNAAQIQWIAGQSKLEIQHINDTLAYAQGVINKIANLKKTLDSLAAVIGFFGVLVTGSPVQIVTAGVKLKQDLDAIET
jgi:hypothetical protein